MLGDLVRRAAPPAAARSSCRLVLDARPASAMTRFAASSTSARRRRARSSSPTSGIMISASELDALARGPRRGLEDRAHLHLVDLRDCDAQAAAAVAEHRVRLVQRVRRASRPLDATPARSRPRARSSSCGRNSCSGGSSRRIVTGSPSIARKMPSKSSRCIGRILSSAARRSSVGRRRGSSRAPRRCASRRRTCARCGRGRCPRRRSSRAVRASCRRVGVGADAQPAELVGPLEDRKQYATEPVG